MTASLSQKVQSIAVLKSLFPPLYHLSLPDVTKRLIPHLNGLELVPKHVAIGRHKIGQPLKQNINIANRQTSATKRTRTVTLQTKRKSNSKST